MKEINVFVSLMFQSDIPQMRLLRTIARLPELKQLLLHPVLVSFTTMKWYKYRQFFIANFVFYLLLASFLTFYVTSVKGLSVEFSLICRVILGLLFGILLIREIVEFFVRPNLTYFEHVENYFELTLFGLGAYLTAQGCGNKISPKAFDENFCPHASAFAIPCTWIGFIFLIGKHPLFSVQIAVLSQVLTTFVKCFIVYVPLILAFALSFHILFHESSDPFADFGDALTKTIVMMTGELDAGNIPFSVYTGTSQVIFLTFVFLVTIVLVNLLNGLAVHDTNLIRNNAKLHTCKVRVIYLASLEEFILKANRTKYGRACIKWFNILKCEGSRKPYSMGGKTFGGKIIPLLFCLLSLVGDSEKNLLRDTDKILGKKYLTTKDSILESEEFGENIELLEKCEAVLEEVVNLRKLLIKKSDCRPR